MTLDTTVLDKEILDFLNVTDLLHNRCSTELNFIAPSEQTSSHSNIYDYNSNQYKFDI